MKNFIAAVIVLVILAIAYYALSPLWRNPELDEASPLTQVNDPVINDNLDDMDPETRAEMEAQVEAMKDEVKDMEESEPSGARLLAQADFLPRAHAVEGRALLIDDNGELIVRFEDFETINGPDLDIYLAADLGADDFINLGNIRATRGNVNYTVPTGTDIGKYNKVLVWCEDFSVLFSYAELE